MLSNFFFPHSTRFSAEISLGSQCFCSCYTNLFFRFIVSLFLHVRCYRNFNEAIYAATSTIVGRVNEKSFHGHLDIDLEVFKTATKQSEIYHSIALLRKIQLYRIADDIE